MHLRVNLATDHVAYLIAFFMVDRLDVLFVDWIVTVQELDSQYTPNMSWSEAKHLLELMDFCPVYVSHSVHELIS